MLEKIFDIAIELALRKPILFTSYVGIVFIVFLDSSFKKSFQKSINIVYCSVFLTLISSLIIMAIPTLHQYHYFLIVILLPFVIKVFIRENQDNLLYLLPLPVLAITLLSFKQVDLVLIIFSSIIYSLFLLLINLLLSIIYDQYKVLNREYNIRKEFVFLIMVFFLAIIFSFLKGIVG